MVININVLLILFLLTLRCILWMSTFKDSINRHQFNSCFKYIFKHHANMNYFHLIVLEKYIYTLADVLTVYVLLILALYICV